MEPDLNRLDGYSINISESLNSSETWQCYKDDELGLPYNSTPSHLCRSLGRFVTFSREKEIVDDKGEKAVINICEFEVYGCPQSRYGDNYTLNGSVGCLNSRCDPDNGQCNCSSNWSGVKCDENYCSSGRYLLGDGCISCPSGCLGNNCNHVNGECLNGCKPSFYGRLCNFTCPINCSNTSCEKDNGLCFSCKAGFYGDRCHKKCQWSCKGNICKHDNGFCTSCNNYFNGGKCIDCVDGYFGDHCTIPCSEGCDNNVCRKNNGSCINSCKDAFYGDVCDQSCPANCKNNKCTRQTGDCSDGCRSGNFLGNKCFVCVTGLYGKNCDEECPVNCKHRMCHETDGSCVLGCKHANMTGKDCDDIQTETPVFQTSSYIGSIISEIIFVINIIFVAVILILVRKRRLKEPGNENQRNSLRMERNQQDIFDLEHEQPERYETLDSGNQDYINTYSAETYTNLNFTEGSLNHE